MKLPYINMISQQELCDHIEDDDFFLRYGNPVSIKADDGNIALLMAIEKLRSKRRNEYNAKVISAETIARVLDSKILEQLKAPA